MKTNLDTLHRLIRVILGIVLAVVEYKLKIHMGLYFVAALLGLTGLFGFCPLMGFFKKD